MIDSRGQMETRLNYIERRAVYLTSQCLPMEKFCVGNHRYPSILRLRSKILVLTTLRHTKALNLYILS